jgi:hypothetical protein
MRRRQISTPKEVQMWLLDKMMKYQSLLRDYFVITVLHDSDEGSSSEIKIVILVYQDKDYFY